MSNLPFLPVATVAAAAMRLPLHTDDCAGCHNTASRFGPVPQCLTGEGFARALKVSPTTVQKWRQRGIPPMSADRLANALGLHPAEVWGDAWWQEEAA